MRLIWKQLGFISLGTYLVFFLTGASCNHPSVPGPGGPSNPCDLSDFNFDYVRGNQLRNSDGTPISADFFYPKYDYRIIDPSTGRESFGRQRINLIFVTMAEDVAKFNSWSNVRGNEIIDGIVNRFNTEKLEPNLFPKTWGFFDNRGSSQTYDLNVRTETIAPPSDSTTRANKQGMTLDVPYFDDAGEARDYVLDALTLNQNPFPSSVVDGDPNSWTVYVYLAPVEELGNVQSLGQAGQFVTGTESCSQAEVVSLGHSIIYMGTMRRKVALAYDNFKNNPMDRDGNPVGSFPSTGTDDNIRKEALINLAYLVIKHEALGHGFSRKWVFITNPPGATFTGATYHCLTPKCLMNPSWPFINYSAVLPDNREVAAMRATRADIDEILIKNETGPGKFCEFHRSYGNVLYLDKGIRIVQRRR